MPVVRVRKFEACEPPGPRCVSIGTSICKHQQTDSKRPGSRFVTGEWGSPGEALGVVPACPSKRPPPTPRDRRLNSHRITAPAPQAHPGSNTKRTLPPASEVPASTVAGTNIPNKASFLTKLKINHWRSCRIDTSLLRNWK